MLWEEDEDTGERDGNSQSRPRRIRRKLKQHSERGGYDLVLVVGGLNYPSSMNLVATIIMMVVMMHYRWFAPDVSEEEEDDEEEVERDG